MCFSQTLLAGFRTGEYLDRGLQTAGVLITATLGLCRLLLVLDTVQAQGIKKKTKQFTVGYTCRLAELQRRSISEDIRMRNGSLCV